MLRRIKNGLREENMILNILNELAATPSINDKVKILQREKNNDLLKRVFQAAYNPMITYGIRQIPVYSTNNVDLTLGNAMDILLTHLSSRSVTGNNAIELTSDILSRLGKDDAIALERIIQRDLRVGCSDSLASRVWPGLVPTFDVMLCDSDIERIEYPAIINLKCDGARAHCYFDGNHLTIMSRAGKEFHVHNKLDETAKKFMKAGETFDGELLVVRDGKVLERKIANGILSTLINITDRKQKMEEEICQLEKKLRELSPENLQ